MATRGRPPKIGEEHREILRAIVAELKRRVGIDAHAATIRKRLREAGIGRVCGHDGAQRVERPVRAGDGYTQAHRRREPDRRDPSCLTDAEWALVKDLFGRAGRPGRPAQVNRRAPADACCDVVRTGCARRMLPRAFPPWHNLYTTFRRRSAAGTFERMHDRLPEYWRAREGRDAVPGAAVLDA